MYQQPKNIKIFGFTLIEVLLYLGLFGVLMGGLLVAGYNIIEASGRNEAAIRMQEEGDFLTDKFSWATGGASSFTVAENPPRLTVYKNNFSKNPLVFSASPASVLLAEGSGSPLALNSNGITIGNLAFRDSASASSSPEGIVISFTLTSNTPTGRTIAQNFNLTRFLQP